MTPSGGAQRKGGGKYSRLRRELSLAVRAGSEKRVCVVTVDESGGDDNLSVDKGFEMVAAHTAGGSGDLFFGVPSTLKQALDHEDSEYWKAAILDEIVNHEEVFQAFGPPVLREPHMSVTPTRFLFSQKLVSLQERQQDARSGAYKRIPTSGDYERFRARLLYVNNPRVSVQSSWDELFAPVVDKTSVRLFLSVSAMYNKHLVHLDIVSAYLHAAITGAPRYITLWGDEPGYVRQLFKAMNGVDSAAQMWNKHFNTFMENEGFLRTARDACIYVHPSSSVQSSLYVDDILASADRDKKAQLDLFVKRVQKMFLVRILEEPKRFLGMEIFYLREQGLCCISQQSYVEKLAKQFLSDSDTAYPAFPTTPMEVNVYDKLELAEREPLFEGPYRSLVGGLLYLFVCTRVEIGFAISILTQHLGAPKPTHFLMAKRVLLYLQGTKSYGLVLGGACNPSLVAFSDASFANDKSDRKSMGGYIVFLGNSPVSWAAKKHRGIQALSITESEIIQVVETTKELLWLQPLLLDLGIHFDFETDLHTDKQPARHILLNNPTHSNRTKHMDMMYQSEILRGSVGKKRDNFSEVCSYKI